MTESDRGPCFFETWCIIITVVHRADVSHNKHLLEDIQHRPSQFNAEDDGNEMVILSGGTSRPLWLHDSYAGTP